MEIDLTIPQILERKKKYGTKTTRALYLSNVVRLMENKMFPTPEMWRTPTATDCQRGVGKAVRLMKEGKMKDEKGRQVQVGLDAQVQMFPTPVRRDYKGKTVKKDMLLDKVGGQLNPTWVEWLMGFPLGWTELSALEMQSFRKLQRSLRKQLKLKKTTSETK